MTTLSGMGTSFRGDFRIPPPFLTITVVPMPEAHEEFRHTPVKAKSFHTHPVTAIADMGAQTCSCGLEVQKTLGYPDQYLIPTSHQIQGITEGPLDIRGVMFAWIRAGLKETYQAIYVSENTSGFYLSESALKKLGLLPTDFPTLTSQQNVAISHEGKAPCGCPQRSIIPPKPVDIPFEPTEGNRHRLEEWVLEHFRASAFNTRVSWLPRDLSPQLHGAYHKLSGCPSYMTTMSCGLIRGVHVKEWKNSTQMHPTKSTIGHSCMRHANGSQWSRWEMHRNCSDWSTATLGTHRRYNQLYNQKRVYVHICLWKLNA